MGRLVERFFLKQKIIVLLSEWVDLLEYLFFLTLQIKRKEKLVHSNI